MLDWIQVAVTIFCSIFASTGFWAYLQNKREKNDTKTALLLGLAHDRIMYLGGQYIKKGYISTEEYENLNKYLYTPYRLNGGNGSAERIMKEVDKLPFKNSTD